MLVWLLRRINHVWRMILSVIQWRCSEECFLYDATQCIKVWKALHFIMRILKEGNSSTKSLAYTTLVLPNLEYGTACWDPYRVGQIHELDRVQKKAAKFAHHTNESKWETLSQRRKYHAYVLSSKRTLENGRGRLLVTDYNGPTIWALLIMKGKSGKGGKGRISGNIPLWIGPSDSGTGYLQKF